MKPENILLVSKDPTNFDIKISDLGGKTPFEANTIKKIDWNINNKKVTFKSTKEEHWEGIN